MTTTTDDGLEVTGDLLIGAVSGQIDALAVGSGTGSESTTATGLNNEEHRAAVSGSNVELVETGQTGEVELIIRVKGGLEVPAGTPITEVGAFFNGAGGGGTLVFIDNFNAVTVEAGNTEQFAIPVDPRRA
jgi:hypothetical protein